jgi:hypothetical protein
VSSNTHLSAGETVTLFATMPDHQQAVLVDEAKVCWSQGDDFGLAIQKIALQDAVRLKRFISTHRKLVSRTINL